MACSHSGEVSGPQGLCLRTRAVFEIYTLVLPIALKVLARFSTHVCLVNVTGRMRKWMKGGISAFHRSRFDALLSPGRLLC